MWLPIVILSTMEPYFDVNHGRVESSQDTICLESQPLDVSDQLNSWSDQVVRLPSHSTPVTTSSCSTNNTRMGDSQKGPRRPFCCFASVPGSHQWKNTSELANHHEIDFHFRSY